MILQNIVFPTPEICGEEALYYHHTGEVQNQRGSLCLGKGAQVNFLTYFNSFSMGKWREYTVVKTVEAVLECRGRGMAVLWAAMPKADANGGLHALEKKKLGEYRINAEESQEYRFSFGEIKEECSLYIEVTAEEEMELSGGSYQSGQAEAQREIHIAIGICTYRREDFVRQTLEVLRKNILEKEDLPWRSHVHVYVSDNGSTLPLKNNFLTGKASEERIRIFYNKNAGGSGGFGRCMLEAQKDRETYGFTHMLLMDDDIVLEPESLYRTYMFLLLQKEEFTGYMLGGSLLRLDIPYIQHANGECWHGDQKDRIGFTKRKYDLRQELMVVKNEERLPVEYGGWWYCCIPMKERVEHFFPMPLFIHGDDIEYGLRFHGKLLTLNGIGVWHDAFDNRRNSAMEYYDMRNGFICNAIHHPEYSTGRMIKLVCRHMVGQLLKFRYKDQKLTMKAVEDYCQGTAFLKKTDPVALNAEISQMGYRQEDVSSLLEEYHVERYYRKPTAEELYPVTPFALKHKLTLNGWILPGKRECIPVPLGLHPSKMYRYKRVLLFEPESGRGFLAKRERKQLFVTLGRCIRMCALLLRKYRKAVEDYQKNAGELTSRGFWEEYLGESDDKKKI
ncbi:MAG: glycosyltransferase [Lachnospiraceae bacterium]|nr:glycosyltransferase [Lachnospiraceae bacterium]